MGCDQFHPQQCHLPERSGLNLSVEVMPGQRGYQQGFQPGYQQGMNQDPLRNEAFQIARELQSRDPRLNQQGMDQIQNTVRGLDHRGVEAFRADLYQATGRNVLSERHNMPANGPNGQFLADKIDLSNPYTGEVRLGIKAFPEAPPMVMRERPM
jgi:hypothetical protein